MADVTDKHRALADAWFQAALLDGDGDMPGDAVTAYAQAIADTEARVRELEDGPDERDKCPACGGYMSYDEAAAGECAAPDCLWASPLARRVRELETGLAEMLEWDSPRLPTPIHVVRRNRALLASRGSTDGE